MNNDVSKDSPIWSFINQTSVDYSIKRPAIKNLVFKNDLLG